MADPVFLSDMAIWYGGYDLSAELNACNFTLGNAEKDDKTFGDTLDAKYPGLLQPVLDLSGRFSVAAVDAVLWPRVADKSIWPTTLCPPNAPSASPGASGNSCYTLTGAQTAYDPLSASHGDLIPFKTSKRPRSTGLVARGTVVLPKTAYAATTNGTAYQLGAVTASQRLLCVLHVFAVVLGTWTVTIESDNVQGMGTATTQATFTGATGVTRQIIEVAGPITDDWWRAVITETVAGTSATAAVALHILPTA